MSVITSVSGSITHNSPVIITGSGFGSKATAAPVVWDNCSGDDVLDLWDVNYNYDSPVGYEGALNFSADLSTIIPPIEGPIIEEEWKEEGEGPWNFTQADNKQGSSIYGYWYKGVSPTESPVWEI